MRDTSRRLNARRRRHGKLLAGRVQRHREEGTLKRAVRQRSRTWKRNLGPEVPEAKRKVIACLGVPEVGRYPGYECNRRRIVQWAVGHPGVRCRECTVCTAYRTTLSRWDPEVVIAILKKLLREKKVGRLAQRPANYGRGQS